MQRIVNKNDDYNSEGQVTKDEWLKILSDDNEPPRDCRRPKILREYDNEKTNLHP